MADFSGVSGSGVMPGAGGFDPSFLSAGGDILEGIGGLESGFGEQEIFNYNAEILNSQADQAMVSEAFSEAILGKEKDAFLGRETAKVAVSGVTMSGSPTDALLQSATNFEMDRLAMNYNAQVKAQGLRSQAANEKYYGAEAANAGIAKLGSSLLTAGHAFL